VGNGIKTLDQYINYVNKDFFNLRNVSTIKTFDGIEYLAGISLEKYIPILKQSATLFTFDDTDVQTYSYRPKLLSMYLYETDALYHLILLLNDMTVEKFIPKQIYLLKRSDRGLIENIINLEKTLGTI
jgi:hypothetical protein